VLVGGKAAVEGEGEPDVLGVFARGGGGAGLPRAGKGTGKMAALAVPCHPTPASHKARAATIPFARLTGSPGERNTSQASVWMLWMARRA
jgi:hypothetical protein